MFCRSLFVLYSSWLHAISNWSRPTIQRSPEHNFTAEIIKLDQLTIVLKVVDHASLLQAKFGISGWPIYAIEQSLLQPLLVPQVYGEFPQRRSATCFVGRHVGSNILQRGKNLVCVQENLTAQRYRDDNVKTHMLNVIDRGRCFSRTMLGPMQQG